MTTLHTESDAELRVDSLTGFVLTDGTTAPDPRIALTMTSPDG